MKITFLGTGTSTGVPEVGCKCAVCTSTDKRDNRLRTSLLVEIDDIRILLDCGPDFRQQMMDIDFRKLDGVLLSHEHYDHVGGIDDLRPFTRHGDINIYCEPKVANAIHTRMPYCFGASLYPGVPKISLNEIKPDEDFYIGITKITPIRVMHGKLPILGYRIGNMAYLTDASQIPEEEYKKLTGLKMLVISALRYKEHISHQNLEEALAQAERIGADKTYFIHMSHDIGLHDNTNATLPKNITLSYDGLVIEG
ncbi:MAG: MBL fold metallo-hydrolase [bacterium]